MAKQTVTHSIPPTYDANSRVLVLGTMPSPKSRELGFNYGHPQNRFWRVMAQLADEPAPTTNARKRDFCLRHHIALWDVLAECTIDGASDASIADAVPNDLRLITQAAPIEAVFCTGAKAYELYTRLCQADVGMPAVKLPSTSPANAACTMERLLAEYAAIFEHTHEPPERTLPVPDVVALEQAIAAAGTPLSELMDRAGAAVAHRVQGILDGAAAVRHAAGDSRGFRRQAKAAGVSGTSPVVILCGNGNNGGDGWVAAALLAQAGVPVQVIAARAPEDLKAQPARDAAIAAQATLVQAGTPVFIGAGEAEVADALSRAAVIVDAVMGTGSTGAPRQPFASWIEAANAVPHAFRLAVDVPSGIDSQTGAASQPHFTADETITMMVRKPGLTAPECGRVHVAPLAYLEPFLD